jgi:hypothetical protein
MALRKRMCTILAFTGLMEGVLSTALVGVTGVDGKSIFDGKIVTGFSNAEEEIVGKVKVGRHIYHGATIANEVLGRTLPSRRSHQGTWRSIRESC